MTDATDLATRTITALRDHHDQLTALVAAFGPDDLRGPSAASEWRICDVLSHLGSGAEIGIAGLVAARDGVPATPTDNEAIWARWNAATPEEQAAWFVVHDAHLVETVEDLTREQLATAQVEMSFLPAPLPIAGALGMRLNEVALHTWDVRAGLDPTAEVDADAAEILLDMFSGPLGFLLGFVAKPDQLAQPAAIDIAGRGLSIDDSAALLAEPPVAPTATFSGTAGAAIRLVSGRLAPTYTAEDVAVTGSLTLDDLRRVFPGY